MKISRRPGIVALGLALGAAIALPARAQEVLPGPDQPFKGHVGRTTKDSKLDFPKEVQAPQGAPNILLVLTDDVGFAASSPFGGPIPTAAFDRLAKAGLRTRSSTPRRCARPRARRSFPAAITTPPPPA
jgi:arylsulfatase